MELYMHDPDPIHTPHRLIIWIGPQMLPLCVVHALVLCFACTRDRAAMYMHLESHVVGTIHTSLTMNECLLGVADRLH